jgi:hypothetical protein
VREDVKTAWLEALRSNTYVQGKRRLKNVDNTFCCLGVLCDLYIKSKNFQWEKHDDSCFALHDARSILPREVMDWAGLDSNNPTCDYHTLSSYNDNGKSFHEIAGLIEVNL